MPRTPGFLSFAFLLLAVTARGDVPAVTDEYPVSDAVMTFADSAPNSIASNGSSFLVGLSRGHAMLVDRNGQPSSRTGIALSPMSGAFASPAAVESNGEEYAAAFLAPGQVHIALVDAGGIVRRTEVVDDAGIGLYMEGPDFAWDGSRFLLVWRSRQAGQTDDQLFGMILDRDGRIITTSFQIAAYRSPIEFSVASNGKDFLLAGTSFDACLDNVCERNLFAVPIGPTGVVGERYVIPAEGPFAPRLTFDGESYSLVWNDYHSPSLGVVHSTHLHPQGVPKHPAIRLPLEPGRLEVTSNGRETIVLSSAPSCLCAVRIGRDGTVLDPAPRSLGQTAAESQPSAHLGWNGSEYLLVWSDRSNPTDATFGSRAYVTPVSASLTSEAAATPLIDQAVSQESPAIAGGGGIFAVVWTEQSPSKKERSVVATRMTPDGRSLDGAGLKLSPASAFPMRASVAFGGDRFLVVWEEDRGIRGRFLLPGSPLPEETITISMPGTATFGPVSDAAPVVVWNGRDFLVAWVRRTPVSFRLGDTRVIATHVTREGRVTEPAGVELTPGGVRGSRPAIVWTGTSYLLAYEKVVECERFCIPNEEIHTRLIGADGAPTGDETLLGSSPDHDIQPSISWNGSDFTVAWARTKTNPFGFTGHASDLHYVQLDAAGVPLQRDPSILAGSSLLESQPHLLWNGAHTIALWEEGPWNEQFGFAADSNVRLARLDRRGIAIPNRDGSTSALMAASPQHEHSAAIALENGRLAVAYVRIAPERGLGPVPRVYVRFANLHERVRAVR